MTYALDDARSPPMNNAKARRRGEDAPNAKLSDVKVAFLRGGACNLHELSRMWGVDRKTLRLARDRKTWAHL